MSYQELGEVEVVVLGGMNKSTGKKNPTELEGYLQRVEKRPNKFNPDKPQNFYVFLTEHGEKGIYAKAGINRVLRNAVYGAMTKLVATDELLDTGKGNPMKVFKAYQDKTNTIDVSASAQVSDSGSYEETSEEEFEEELPLPPAPKAPVTPRSPASIQQTRAFLKSRSG